MMAATRMRPTKAQHEWNFRGWVGWLVIVHTLWNQEFLLMKFFWWTKMAGWCRWRFLTANVIFVLLIMMKVFGESTKKSRTTPALELLLDPEIPIVLWMERPGKTLLALAVGLHMMLMEIASGRTLSPVQSSQWAVILATCQGTKWEIRPVDAAYFW